METKKLAEFASSVRFEDLDAKTVQKTKQTILDWLGVCIYGLKEEPARILEDVLLSSGGKEEATVLDGDNHRTNVLNATFCNAAGSHTLDFDDVHCPSIMHLSTVVMPPVFALAEAKHLSGREMIAAIVAGFEVGSRVGESVVPESYFFWHTTATAGVFGSGAAASRLLKLDAGQTAQALGSAGTQAAGLWEFLEEGAMSKPLHAGKAAYAGVLAAMLAQKGFTGATTILEGEKGFCHAMLPNPHMEKLTENLGKGYKINEDSYKPYPCCKHAHSSVYAVQQLAKKYGLTPDKVAKIELHVNNVCNTLINDPVAENPVGCKFSVQYCVSTMFCLGQLTINEFLPENIHDQKVRDLMKRIDVIMDKEIDEIHVNDPTKYAAKVVIVDKEGKTYSLQVDYPKGDPPNPMTWDESVDKYNTLAVPVYGKEKAGQLCDLIKRLDTVTDFANELSRILR
jgi:2-methylcitrate dehydratase PrpD